MLTLIPHLMKQGRFGRFLLLVFLLLLLLPPSSCQQLLDVEPPANVTLNLTVYSEDSPLVQLYTLSNAGVYLQVYNITLLPPLHPAVSIALSRQPLFLLEESGSATITLTVNSSLLLPSSFLVSILISYSANGPTLTQHINASVSCLQQLDVSDVLSSPFLLPAGDAVTITVKPRSRPYSDLNISVTANSEHGNISGSTGSGVAWPGGGPLLSVSPSLLSFTAANWNTSQSWTIAAQSSSLIWGDRWSLVSYDFLTSDAYLLPFASLFQALNVTILETNVAGARISSTNLTLQKNSADTQLLLALSCQPRAAVTVTMAANAWAQLTPLQLQFTPEDWNVSVPATLQLFPDFTLGVENVELSFPLLSSADADFASVSPPALLLTLTDPDPSFVAFWPPFGPAGTYVTVTWPEPLTFVPMTADAPLPSVYCVFGAQQFACGSGFCPVYTQASITGNTTVECPVPECTADTQSNEACYSPASFHVSINGVEATLASNVSAAISAACEPLPSSCLVSPSILYSQSTPVSSACLAASCQFFPSAFSYLAPPVLTSVSPLTSELATSNAITVVLTVLGAAPFSSPNATCYVDGVASPAAAAFASALTTTTYPWSVMLSCLTPPLPALLGSTASTPLSFEVSLTGQLSDLSSSGFVLAGVDATAVKNSSDLTLFLVCCLLAFASVMALLFQHYCCRGCSAVHHELTGEGKRRGERGPQMLIDLLEPRVRLGIKLVEEEERRRKAEERAERERVDDRLRRLKAEKREKEEKEREDKEALRRQMIDKEKARKLRQAEQPRSRAASFLSAPAASAGGAEVTAAGAKGKPFSRMLSFSMLKAKKKESSDGQRAEAEKEAKTEASSPSQHRASLPSIQR